MKNRFATLAAWGLAALLVGVSAQAQTNNQGGQSKDEQGEQSKRQQRDARGQDTRQDQGQTETIRGEVAAASVVGETMVDYASGRAVVAELTYLTILGSPDGGGRQGGRGGQASSDRDRDRDDTRRGDQDRNQGDRAENKDQGPNQDQAGRNRGDQERSGEGSAAQDRRNVYQIAISSDTQVRRGNAQRGRGQGQGSGDQPKQKGQGESSAREQSQAALDQLELGDRVAVEFTRMNAQGRSGSGDEGQKGSTDQTRHGRHRIIRGVARTITILSAPDRNRSDDRQDGDSSSRDRQSRSNSQDKDSSQDQDKDK